jgi:hypothetical protein
MLYSQDELRTMVAKMEDASSVFYRMAQTAGCHTFIEFCGLMNKYIDVCRRAAEAGIDFTQTSIHGEGEPLPVYNHDVDYLAEKFACIFGQTMASDPKIWARFQRAIEAEIR